MALLNFRGCFAPWVGEELVFCFNLLLLADELAFYARLRDAYHLFDEMCYCIIFFGPMFVKLSGINLFGRAGSYFLGIAFCGLLSANCYSQVVSFGSCTYFYFHLNYRNLESSFNWMCGYIELCRLKFLSSCYLLCISDTNETHLVFSLSLWRVANAFLLLILLYLTVKSQNVKSYARRLMLLFSRRFWIIVYYVLRNAGRILCLACDVNVSWQILGSWHMSLIVWKCGASAGSLHGFDWWWILI